MYIAFKAAVFFPIIESERDEEDGKMLLSTRRRRIRRAGMIFLFLTPALVFMIFSVYVPFGWNAVLSFQKWNGFSQPASVGFANFAAMFKDDVAVRSLLNSVTIALFSTLGAVVLGLLMSAFMYKISNKEGAIYRLILFLPVMLPTAVVGLLFTFVFNPEMGLLNNLLNAVGLNSWAHIWLQEKSTVIGCIIFVNIWKMSGLTMMLSYASMKMLPSSIFESSRIEGANYWHQYTRLILPLIKPTILMSTVYSLAVNFKSYDIVSVLTNGGPGTTSYTIPINMMKTAFNFSEFGYAAAMGMVLALVVIIIVGIVTKVLKGETYEY